MAVVIQDGMPARLADQAMAVLWDGFAEKLRRPLGQPAQVQALLKAMIRPEAVSLAVDDGHVLGVMAMNRPGVSLTHDEWRACLGTYGWLQAPLRLLLLLPLTSKPPRKSLYIELLAAAPEARGRGVGTRLLAHAEELARSYGLERVALDVVENNPRARALYEDLGFVHAKTTSIKPLQRLYGFTHSHVLVRNLGS